MSATKLVQFAQLARLCRQSWNTTPSTWCPSCGRLFADQASGSKPDPKQAGQATKAPESGPPKEDQAALEKENTRVAAESAAQSVTASMFPWERRQMDGGGTPLNRFERVYWVAFGGAVVFIIGSNVYRYFTNKKEPEVDEDVTKKKEDIAMKLGSGSVSVLQCEDMFEGLTPEEISDFVDSTRNKRIRERHSGADEYDGLSPEEINLLQQGKA